VIAAVRKLVELSAKMEAGGGAAQAAEEALKAPSALLESHDEAVMGGLYQDATERWEVLSLGACDLVAMPHTAAVEAIATTSAMRRFEILLTYLNPAIAELAALTSLDGLGGGLGDGDGLLDLLSSAASAGGATGAAVGPNARQSMLGGTTAFSPIDIPVGEPSAEDGGGGIDIPLGDRLAAQLNGPSQPEIRLPEGARVEFWYNEEYGWLTATVKRRVRGDAGEILHTLEFDVDQTWEDVPLISGDPRWRPLRE